MNRLVLVLAVLAVLAACGKGGDKAGGGSAGGGGAGGGGGARDALIDAWKKGGLSPSAFTPAQTPVGKDCTAGTVNNVDVLVCVFGSPDEAAKAEDAGLAWVGDTTGASHVKGALVIAVRDQHKADLSGRTINQIFKLAPS